MKHKRPIPLFDNVEQLTLNEVPPVSLEELHPADYQYARQFLLMYGGKRGGQERLHHSGSQDTFNSYRREIERLLQWCMFITHKTLSELQATDIENYIMFCQRPPMGWIGIHQVPRFIQKGSKRVPNPKWRPFIVTLSKAKFHEGKKPDPKEFKFSRTSIKHLFVILSSFFNYLVDIEYLSRNPIRTIRNKSRYLPPKENDEPIRRLSEIQWNAVLTTAKALAKQKPEVHERTLFIITILYAMYLRISELVMSSRWEPTMSDFQQARDKSWWFKTVGKGNKSRKIAVSDNVLIALRHYRKFLKLPELPSPRDKTPLLMNLSSKKALGSVRTIRNIVQQCINEAANYLVSIDQQEEAETLPEVTVHWFRHTGISDDVMRRPREHVRNDAGHSSSAITDKYIDVELKKRYESAKDKTLNLINKNNSLKKERM